MEKNLFRLTGYMGASENYSDAQGVLVGVPMDYTISLRPGSRSGPQQIRTISYGIEEYSVYQDKSLEDLIFYDAGDINLPLGNVPLSLKKIEEVAEGFFQAKKFPIFLGGEHLISYPLIKACHRHYPEVIVLHFDAHADLRTNYEGEENSHATVMYKVSQLLGKKRIYQFGIRSGTKEEFSYARENTHMFVDEIFPALNRVLPDLKEKPIYLSIDIDVVDPAFAPGTGTPEPGGCTSREILSAVQAIAPLNVVGMDIVEVSPLNDLSEKTAILAAKIVRESLLAYIK